MNIKKKNKHIETSTNSLFPSTQSSIIFRTHHIFHQIFPTFPPLSSGFFPLLLRGGGGASDRVRAFPCTVSFFSISLLCVCQPRSKSWVRRARQNRTKKKRTTSLKCQDISRARLSGNKHCSFTRWLELEGGEKLYWRFFCDFFFRFALVCLENCL